MIIELLHGELAVDPDEIASTQIEKQSYGKDPRLVINMKCGKTHWIKDTAFDKNHPVDINIMYQRIILAKSTCPVPTASDQISPILDSTMSRKAENFDRLLPQINELTHFCVANKIGQVGDDILTVALARLKELTDRALVDVTGDDVEALHWAVEQASYWAGNCPDDESRAEFEGELALARVALEKVNHNAE